MKRSKGFTLVELLVVVGIIALLVTILMPTLGRAMELARRSICGANLNTIGKGMHIYLAEHEAFPLLWDVGASDAVLNQDTHDDDIWNKAVLKTNAMQNVWLLIKAGTSEKAFQCPSDGDHKERSKSGVSNLKKYGWVDKKNFSYGLHKPYDNDDNSAGENKAPLTQTPQGNFVIMADKNDGSKGPGRIYWNSDNDCNKPSNHKDDGFNCLTYQGSVKFHKAKMGTRDANSKAGVNDDDIYTVEGVNTIPISAAANPKKDYDTFIVPWTG
ncbi:MAG: type II secretion system protein [Planctomycetota bacterium]|jgi:prepilin-type N-terminal cleavage/methylation domain-containing protein